MKLTREQYRLSRRNQYKAWKAFGYSHNNHKGLVLHHKDETLRHNDVERYIEWRPEDLEIMTLKEHTSLHCKGKPKPDNVKTALINAHTGKAPWNKGKKGVQTAWNKGLTKETDSRIAEHSKKVSNTLKGHVPWNKGLKIKEDVT